MGLFRVRIGRVTCSELREARGLVGFCGKFKSLGAENDSAAIKNQLLGPIGKSGGGAWPMDLPRSRPSHFPALRVYKVFKVHKGSPRQNCAAIDPVNSQ